MRLLPHPRPDIDVAVLEKFSVPIEVFVVGGHRLQDKIMRLPEAVHQLGRIAIGGCDLVRDALDKTHVEPAARDHVDGRQLLGGAQRIGPVADRIAEHQKPGQFGGARRDGKPDHHRRRHAGRGLVMLVEHDVEAEIVAELPLVVIAMEQVGGDARVALSVRESDAQRAGMLVPGRVIGLFAEVIDSHGTPLPRSVGTHRSID
jgi:hypothetical protein